MSYDMMNLENHGQIRPAIADGREEPQERYVTNADEKHLRTLKEIYYQWVARLTVLLCVISLTFFASASLVLFRMAPRVTVEPFLIIKQSNSDSMVRYEVIAPQMASSEQLMETFIKQYIMLRNNVIQDEREMQSRWFPGGIVHYMSLPAVYEQFYEKNVTQLENLLKENIVRDTEVISARRVGGERSFVWKVEFRTYDLYRDTSQGKNQLILNTKYWTASITAFFVEGRMFMGRKFMNPLGFTVTRYSQTEVEIL